MPALLRRDLCERSLPGPRARQKNADFNCTPSVRHAPNGREPARHFCRALRPAVAATATPDTAYDATMAIAQSFLDELWDFSDAAASEQRLRAAAAQETDAASRAELETQIARALGLQERYDEADGVLDRIAAKSVAVAVRVALERGRLRNSAGDAAAAVPLFRAAASAAAGDELVFLRVDALHMLAIADTARTDEWTARALTVLDADDRRAHPAVAGRPAQQRRVGAVRRRGLLGCGRPVRAGEGRRDPLGHAPADRVGRRGPRRGPSPALAGDADELLVDELVGREKTHLAGGAGALHAAERQLRRVREDDVDIDHAGVDLVGDARSLLPRRW